MASSSDNFKKMFTSDHPYRRLHVLLSILAFVLVVGSITMYQIKKPDRPEQFVVPEADSTVLTAEQRTQVLANLQESIAKSPPLTDIERNKILEELRKAAQ